MGVPRAAQALAPACRATVPRYRGIGSEAYLNGTSQGPTPEDARKDDHIIRARCAPLSPASGFPVSWSQQVIHEISGLGSLGGSPTRLAIDYQRGRKDGSIITINRAPRNMGATLRVAMTIFMV